MSIEHDPTEDFKTLVELLRWRAAHEPERTALTFLQEGETEEINLTYADLDRRARAIGARLQSLGVAGERALLLYPSGIDFIAALFGCFYAGVIAVPAYPPHANRPLPPRLQALKSDAQASLILTTTQILSNVTGRLTAASEWESLRWLATDSIEAGEAESWRDAKVTGDSLAFLQYTSGSTTSPKGVMVSHRNLLANERMIREAFAQREHPTFVIWLPLFHDMGLIGNVLQSIYVCGRAVLMSPAAFLVKPDRWLRAISHYRADVSGAPNFAYDLCVERVSAEQRESLDLGSWNLAFNGAEPINHQTIERFVDAFGPCGFRRQAFFPCYGLAEATVFVSGGERVDLPVVRSLQSASLERNQAVESGDDEDAKVLVGCGKSWLEQEIAIVDAESRTRCAENRIGEIWVSGPNIAQGYWDRPVETEQTFKAYIEDGKDIGSASSGPFLRTGDLGFLKDGELFITGRLKDLIIIRGRNHYPQDIEWTAEQSHAALRQGVCAAFSVDVAGEERLVIVIEVKRHFQSSQTEEIVNAIRESVAESHELEVYGVSLLRTGHIPKTTSGKVQRRASRDHFLAGSLKVVGEWVQKIQAQDVREQVLTESAQANQTGDASTAEAIQAWLVTHLAARTGVETHLVDVRKPYKSYGLDSVSAVVLIGELAEWLGRPLSPTLVYEYPNISALSLHLASTTTSARASALAPEMLEKPSAVAGTTREPLAIIGIGCRFPGATNATAFWDLLRDGVDAITEVPIERWDARDFYSPTATTRGKMNTRWGGFLEQVDKFDASFFGIAPREAAQMDPQQRLLLEVAWEALEDGGEVAEKLSGTRTGVFVGLAQSEYGAFQLSYPTTVDVYATTGGALSIAANRLSYFFDFRGPSMAVDTACSSSLVAVHLACQSLWNGESTLALAGGVNLILSPSVTISFSQGGALSSDGRCKPFDARADGIVRSEGVGLIVLKPLARALADGNQIYAVIRGSAVNQDGRSNGITAPNSLAQEAVIQEACRAAGVSPGQIQYVETHGTGTLLGDPVEAQALGKSLAAQRRDGQPCVIGSVKSNIGHAEAAAGIASLIKVALSLKHQAIPPSLHFDEPNPHIPFEELRLRIQQTLSPWPEKSGPALAGVSAFGFGGTNAHLILEEAPTRAHDNLQDGEAASRSMHLLPLSAHNAEALQSLARAYRELLSSDEAGDNGYLGSLCNAASMRRGHLDYRLAVAGSSREEIIERLEAFERGEATNGLASGRALAGRSRKPVFVFSGYGGQWWGMGRELLGNEPVFLRSIEECDELLRPYTGWSVLEELKADESQSNLDGSNIEITQISLFALQIALAALLRSWGIEPHAVVGHSLGEVAAAQVAGVLSLADAVRVIFHRARLMQRQLEQLDLKGAMASVDLSRADAEQLLVGYEDRLSIAVHNAPGAVVLAGEAAALDELLETLKQRGINGRKVHAPGAGHSPHAEAIKSQLEEALDGLRPEPASIAVFSTVTGRQQEGQKFDAAYWGRNVRQPVLFAEAIEELARLGHDLFLELSPHPILSPAVTQGFEQHERQADVLPTLRRRRDAQAALFAALGKLYTHGQPVRWQSLCTQAARLVRLPSYPWQRERFWIEEQGMTNGSDAEKFSGRRKATSSHPVLGERIRSAAYTGTHTWEKHIEIDLHPYLGRRRIGGRAFMPTAIYMEMVMAAAGEVFGKGAHVLEDVSFQEALVLSDEAAASQTVQVVISDLVSGTASFQFFSLDAGDTTPQQELWTLRARGKIRLASEIATLPQETAPRP